MLFCILTFQLVGGLRWRLNHVSTRQVKVRYCRLRNYAGSESTAAAPVKTDLSEIKVTPSNEVQYNSNVSVSSGRNVSVKMANCEI